MTIISPNSVIGSVNDVALDYGMRMIELSADPKKRNPTEAIAAARLFREFLLEGVSSVAEMVDEVGSDMDPMDRQAESLGFMATVAPVYEPASMFGHSLSNQDIGRILGLDAAAASALGIVDHE